MKLEAQGSDQLNDETFSWDIGPSTALVTTLNWRQIFCSRLPSMSRLVYAANLEKSEVSALHYNTLHVNVAGFPHLRLATCDKPHIACPW